MTDHDEKRHAFIMRAIVLAQIALGAVAGLVAALVVM